jgi:hypothetical protein
MSDVAGLLRDLKWWGRKTGEMVSVIEEYVNKGRVAANALWSVVVGLMVVGWAIVLLLPDHWILGGMFGLTACATSALAATLHIRCYMVRLAGLVRAVGSIEREDGPAPLRRL